MGSVSFPCGLMLTRKKGSPCISSFFSRCLPFVVFYCPFYGLFSDQLSVFVNGTAGFSLRCCRSLSPAYCIRLVPVLRHDPSGLWTYFSRCLFLYGTVFLFLQLSHDNGIVVWTVFRGSFVLSSYARFFAQQLASFFLFFPHGYLSLIGFSAGGPAVPLPSSGWIFIQVLFRPLFHQAMCFFPLLGF